MVNTQVAAENPRETLICDVRSFRTSKRASRVEFIFNGKPEHVGANLQTLRHYFDEDPGQHEIVIRAREGIWEHYIVDEWTLRKK